MTAAVEKKLPIYGRDLPGEKLAGEEIPFYRFLKRGSSSNLVVKATANSQVIGVSIPDEMLMTLAAADGARTLRNSFPINREVSAYAHGLVYVQVGAGGVTQDAQVVSDSNGQAVLYAAPDLSGITSTKDGDVSTAIKTAITAVLNSQQQICGTAKEAGNNGDFVLVDLDDK